MGNNASNFAIIRVTPTLETAAGEGAYADGDVLFTATEIPNAVRGAAGCSKLVNCFIMDQDRDTFAFDMIFTEANTAIGTIHATANISDADMEAIGFCGALSYNSATAPLPDLDNVKICKAMSLSGASESTDPMLIQAAAGSTSVYVSAVISDGTPTFAAADDIDIILHIEYK